MNRITVFVETTGGGPALERCLAAYRTAGEADGCELEVLVRAHRQVVWSGFGDFVHLTSDRFEPHPGWWQAAVSCCNAGMLPAPALWSPQGVHLGDEAGLDWSPYAYSCLPFLSRAQTERIEWPDYYSPQGVGRRAVMAGLACVLRTEYAFTDYGEPRV